MLASFPTIPGHADRPAAKVSLRRRSLQRRFSERRFSERYLFHATLAVGWLLTAALPAQDFKTQIAPILQQHCLACHSDAEASGEVSFTTARGFADSNSVIPGRATASRLMELIEPDERQRAEMPRDAPPLNADQRQLLADWIDAGAVWPDDLQLIAPEVADRQWWSLLPLPAAQPIPSALSAAHPIDALVNARMDAMGLEPQPEASPEVLVRRIYYDLSGLPPTPEQVDAYLVAYRIDPQQAWKDLVDRLLASPMFGEKYGQFWLDVARYAETHGYDKDKPRNNAWPYRDYVIRSLNADKPFDRFVQEQVAGDVLFPGEPEGILGLGFLAAGPWDFIGHVEVGEGKLDGRIAKHLDRDEMLGAVFNVFLSTTIQCAQCHDHKFDPLRMEDYYRSQAVFAGVDRADREYDRGSALNRAAIAELTEQKRQLQFELDGLQARSHAMLAEITGDLDSQLANFWKSHVRILPDPYGYHSQIEAKPDVVKWVQVDLGQSMPLHQVRLIPAYDDYAGIGSGFGFPVGYQILASDDAGFSDAGVLVHDTALANPTQPRSSPVEVHATGVRGRYLRLVCTQLAERQGDYIFALAELEVLDAAGTNVALGCPVTALDTIEAPPRWGLQNLTDGAYWQKDWDRHAVLTLGRLELQRSELEQQVMTGELRQQLELLRTKLRGIEQQLADYPPGERIYSVASQFSGEGQFQPTGGRVRPIHLLHRGDVANPRQALSPAAPPLWDSAATDLSMSIEAEMAAVDGANIDTVLWDEGAARAGLARYLTAQDNPLFWRSIANRVWQWTFDQPLVETPNDFGRMGSPPTHPELLDYLAERLRQDPQRSLKGLVRLMVTSETYRRASQNAPANVELDANNRYLWRGKRRRLTAEEFRDSLLFVSGELRVAHRGGPSFQDFVVEKPEHSPHYQYHLADPRDPATFRRSIYRFVVRSQPQPMLTTLDCADPSLSVPQRDESTTALQALTQWNGRLVEAMSERFADRLRREIGDASAAVRNAEATGREERQLVQRACRLALGRLPTSEEEGPLVELAVAEGTEVLARVLFNMSAFNYVE